MINEYNEAIKIVSLILATVTLLLFILFLFQNQYMMGVVFIAWFAWFIVLSVTHSGDEE